MTVITLPLSGVERLGLLEGLREEETRRFWPRKVAKALTTIMPATCRTPEANTLGRCGLTSEPVVSWIFLGKRIEVEA